MEFRNSRSRYSMPMIGLHWLTLLLLVAVYACMELRGFTARGSAPRANMMTLHYLLGLLALVLVIIRIGVRWNAGAAPHIRPPMPGWQDKLARLLHFALYAFMVIAPILGWLTLSAEGRPIVLFGLPVPSLVGADKSLARQLKELHEGLATAGYFMIGLHAVAALFHHYVTRDNTLVRMLP